MTTEQNIYLENIGITGALLTKVEDIEKYYTEFLSVKIDDIFISEFLNADGSRVYENIWFFNENFCYEAKFFMTSEDYDTDVLKKSIKWFNLKKSNFDIINNITNENSRMSLEFGLNDNRYGILKASKENCKQASIILKKYIQPNYGTEL